MAKHRTWPLVLALCALTLPATTFAGTTLAISPEKIKKPVVRTLDDPANQVGQYTSIAIGRDGYPVLSYRDSTAGDLKLYRCADATCSSGSIQTLDSTENVGQYTSIAIGRDGAPVISYRDNTNSDLKFYKCNNMTCTTGSAYTLESLLNVGEYTSVTMGVDGNPVISYLIGAGDDLKVYACSDPSCTAGTASPLDTTGIVGLFTSIAIGRDGYPVISYYDFPNGALKLYKCNNVACTTGTATTLDDPANNVGFFTSIAIGRDGYPVISYYDATATALKLYKCNDVACTTGTALTLDDSANDIGQYASLAIGRDGYPAISYYDATDKDLKLLKCGNTSCTATSTLTIDSRGDVGQYTSMKIGNDGYPVISYYDATNGALKFAYVGNQVKLSTTPPTSPKTAGGLVGWWTFDGKDVDWRANKVLDRSGLGNHGAIINMATSTAGKPGKIGQGFKFDGAVYGAGQKISIGNTSSLNNLSQRTIVAWIYPKVGFASPPRIIDKDKWRLDTNGFGQKMLLLTENWSGGNGSWYSPPKGVPFNMWTHIAVTYDRSSAANAPSFYINGVATTTAVNTSPSGSHVSDASDAIYLAGDFNTPGSNSFNGTLDDVRIYNRILTAQEIKDLYNQTKGSTVGKCGPGPVLDADGNKYSIVQIGTQCWLDRNMNVGTRINGATAQTNNATIEKYCYNDTASNCTDAHPKWPDGGLYQWDEAMQYSTTEGARGICPAGWHIPTDAEWYTLENFLKNNNATCDAGRSNSFDCISAGMKLRSGGSSGFEGNGSGTKEGGLYKYRNAGGFFWTSSENVLNARTRDLDFGLATVYRGEIVKTDGRSVRCIKN